MQNKPTSIKELCKFIWYLEDKYNLLDFQLDGIKVWQYVRMRIYYKLGEDSGVLAQSHSKLTKIDKMKHLLAYIKNSLSDNYFTLKQKDVVVFSHPRVVAVNGELIDIYTKYFIDELLKEKKEIVEFENAHLGVHKKKKQSFAHYIDWITLTQKVYLLFLKIDIPNDKLITLKKVENHINSTCQCNIDFISFIIKSAKAYKAEYRIYNKIFQKVKPKVCYMVVSYGKAPIIKAAKDNSIDVVELQHGTFSKYHLGYSFPGRKEPLEYFPSKLYVWNDFWKKIIKLPIANECIIVDQFRYLEKQKNQLHQIKKQKNQLIVLSQGAIGDIIAKRFLKYYDRFKEYKIKYKLHPGEFDRWQKYTALKELNQFDNVEIIKDEIPLYVLFAESNLQIGVFSTALYEGVEFECDTILLDINGIEYMEKFIKNNKVEII